MKNILAKRLLVPSIVSLLYVTTSCKRILPAGNTRSTVKGAASDTKPKNTTSSTSNEEEPVVTKIPLEDIKKEKEEIISLLNDLENLPDNESKELEETTNLKDSSKEIKEIMEQIANLEAKIVTYEEQINQAKEQDDTQSVAGLTIQQEELKSSLSNKGGSLKCLRLNIKKLLSKKTNKKDPKSRETDRNLSNPAPSAPPYVPFSDALPAYSPPAYGYDPFAPSNTPSNNWTDSQHESKQPNTTYPTFDTKG